MKFSVEDDRACSHSTVQQTRRSKQFAAKVPVRLPCKLLNRNHSNCCSHNIIHSVDGKDHVSVLVLLYLSAAYDTVNHGILMVVVLERCLGISGIACRWYCSYLAERTQTFQVGTVLSRTHKVRCSDPQGSVLGALKKFITYTENLPAVIEKRNIDHHLYADDGQLS